MSFVWLDALQRLRAIAQTGLTFTRDPYDRERYRETAAIAELGLADDESPEPQVAVAARALQNVNLEGMAAGTCDHG